MAFSLASALILDFRIPSPYLPQDLVNARIEVDFVLDETSSDFEAAAWATRSVNRVTSLFTNLGFLVIYNQPSCRYFMTAPTL